MAVVKEQFSASRLTTYLSSVSKMSTTSFSFDSRPRATRNIAIADTSSYKQRPSMKDRKHASDYTFYKTKQQFFQEKV